MKYLLCSAVFWILVGAFLVQNTATSGAVRNQSSQAQARAASRPLQLTASVIAQEYCRNAVTQESELDLKLKLSVKNTSATTVLVSRYANWINRVVLSKSLPKAKTEDYVYEQRSTSIPVSSLEKSDIPRLSPTVEFVTLKPGESFAYEYPQRADITLTDSSDPGENVAPGRYLLQVKIRTWPWRSKNTEALEQHWAHYGSLWYRDITSEPLAILIEKPGPTISACKVP